MLSLLKLFKRVKPCRAYAEKTGARCSRLAVRGTPYCWQHQPKLPLLLAMILVGAKISWDVVGDEVKALIWPRRKDSIHVAYTPKPKFEVWADGVHLTNENYVLPIDTNKVGLINFLVVNRGDGVAQHVRLHIDTFTNIQLSGLGWLEVPPPLDNPSDRHVYTEVVPFLNPSNKVFISTLRIWNDGPIPLAPLTISIDSDSPRFEVFARLFLIPGEGKLTPIQSPASSKH